MGGTYMDSDGDVITMTQQGRDLVATSARNAWPQATGYIRCGYVNGYIRCGYIRMFGEYGRIVMSVSAVSYGLMELPGPASPQGHPCHQAHSGRHMKMRDTLGTTMKALAVNGGWTLP